MSHPEAREAYLRGCALVDPEDWQKALAYFDRAIQLDPDYAEAYCQRGLVYMLITLAAGRHFSFSDIHKCKRDLYYALALNPNVEGADLARRSLEALLRDNYWQKAKDYGEKMMEMHPENAPPRLVYRKKALDFLAQVSSQERTQQEKLIIEIEVKRLEIDPTYAKRFFEEIQNNEILKQLWATYAKRFTQQSKTTMDGEDLMRVTPAQQKPTPQPQQKKKSWW